MSADEVISEVAREAGLRPEDIMGPLGTGNNHPHRAVRAKACWAVRMRCAFSIKDVAVAMRLHHSTVWEYIRGQEGYLPLSPGPGRALYEKCGHERTPENTAIAVQWNPLHTKRYINTRCRECMKVSVQLHHARRDAAEEAEADYSAPAKDVGRCKRCFLTEPHTCLEASGWARRNDGNVAEGMTTGRVRP